MKVHPGTLLLILLTWTAQETFCKGTTAGGIANGECGKVCKDIDGKQWCDYYCKNNNGALVKVYMGPVMPTQVPLSFNWDFELCQDGKCVEAARLISKGGFFIRQKDVTRVLVEQGWSPKKWLTARMTSSSKTYVADNFDVGTLPDIYLEIH